MTVRGGPVSQHIHNEFKRDILTQLLWKKTTAKKRRELANSAKTSFSSHLSRKILLEEHKLEIRLEQIEKERRHFINKNNNEKYMLQLSIRSSSCRKTACRSQNAVIYPPQASRTMNVERRPYTIQRCHSEDNEIFGKPSRPTGVFLFNGPRYVKKLETHNLYSSRTTDKERRQLKGCLFWKRDYVTPQVPPPSRSPSKTELLLVQLKNAFNASDIFFESESESKKCQKTTAVTTADLKPCSFPNAKQATLNCPIKYTEKGLAKNKWITVEKPEEVLHNVDIVFPTSSPSEAKINTEQKPSIEAIKEESPQFLITSVFNKTKDKPLSPSVKKLNIKRTIHDDVFRSSTKSRASTSEEKVEKKNDDITKFHEINKPNKVENNQETTVQNQNNSRGSFSKYVDDRRKVANDRREIVVDRQEVVVDRREAVVDRHEVVTARGEVRGNCKAKRHKKSRERPVVMSERKNEFTTAASMAKKTNAQKTRKIIRKTQDGKDIRGMCIQAKRFLAKEKSKTTVDKWKPSSPDTRKSENKINVNKEEDKTNVPRKRCAVCAEKFAEKDTDNDPDKKNVSKDAKDTTVTTCEAANESDDGCSKVASEGKVARKSPLAILLPSESQMHGFDEAIERKTQEKLAIQIRRHAYTGALGFQQKLATGNKNIGRVYAKKTGTSS